MLNRMKLIFNLLLLQIIYVASEDLPKLPNCKDTKPSRIHDPDTITGDWYFVATSSAPKYDCMKSEIHLTGDNKTMHIAVKRSEHDSFVLKDTLEATFPFNELQNENGFTIKFSDSSEKLYKILDIYNQHLFLCSYEKSKPETEAGFILTRQQIVPEKELNDLKQMATNFCTSLLNLKDVKQNELCFQSPTPTSTANPNPNSTGNLSMNLSTMLASIIIILIWTKLNHRIGKYA